MAQGGKQMIHFTGGAALAALTLGFLAVGIYLVRGKYGWIFLILLCLTTAGGSYHWTTMGWLELQEGKVDWGECKQMGREKVILQYEGHKYYDYKDKCEKYGPIRIWAKGQWRVIVDQPKGRVME